jgi:[ribosomal protein S5]-alanine N-acetyltransferase
VQPTTQTSRNANNMPLPTFHAFSTSRTTVRPVQASDLSDLFEINGDDAVTQFLPYATWQSPEDGAAWLKRMEALTSSGSGHQLVILRKHDGKVIGTILLFKFDEASARFELGYVLGRAYWRQGYACEAIRAVCNSAFREMKARRIEAEVNPDNIASNALLRSLGFVHEGTLRKRWVAKGVTYDTNIFGCLSTEWSGDSNG